MSTEFRNNKENILNDKFNIIYFDDTQDKEIKLFDIYNFYLENLILNNKKCVSPELIHQLIWKKIYIDKNIKKNYIFDRVKNIFIKNISIYLKRKRSEFRIANKKGNFDINIIITFINNYIRKLKNIVNFISPIEDIIEYYSENDKMKKIFGNSEFITIGLSKLCSHVLSDIIVTNIIKNNILNNKKYNFYEFKNFSILMKNIGCYYSENLNWYKNVIAETIGENIPNNNYSILKKYNSKLINLYNLSDLISFYKFCNKRFSFLKDPVIFSYIFSKLNTIVESILNINKSDNPDYLSFIINFLENYCEEVSIYLKNDNKNIYKFSSINELFNSKNQTNIIYSINYYNNIKNILENNCKKDKDLRNKSWLFEEKLIKNFSDINKINSAIKIIHKNILKNDLDSNKGILYLISKSNQIDYFIEVYKKFLILRILDENLSDLTIKTEKLSLILLTNRFKKKYTYKISKIIKDYEKSISMLNDFINIDKYNYTINKNKLNLIITSYKTWDLNLSEGNLSNSCDLYKNLFIIGYLNKINNFYKIKYENKRYLIFYPHVGNLDLTFHTKFKNVKLLLLPIHGIIFDIITSNEDVKYNISIKKIFDIFSNISNYNNSLINDAITSLVKVNILIINKNVVSLNLNYNDKDEINVIDEFFKISSLDIKWEMKSFEELAHSKETILSSIINSYLKSYKKYDGVLSYEKLFEIVSSNKNKSFEITNDLMNKTLKTMEKMEYIKKQENGYKKLFY